MKRVYFAVLAMALVVLFAEGNLAMADDISNSAPAIKLLSPVGGEQLKVGDTVQIRWTTPAKGKLKLYVLNGSILKDAGSGAVNYIQEELVDASSGHFDWLIAENKLPLKGSYDDAYQILLDDADGNPLDSSYAFSIAR